MKNESLKNITDRVTLAPVMPTTFHRTEFSAEPQAGSVLDYCRMLGRRKLVIATCGFLGLLVGIGVTLPQAPLYRARTSIEIQDAKDDAMTMKALNLIGDTASTDGGADLETQIKILQSRMVIERALKQAKITGSAATNTRERIGWHRFLLRASTDQSEESLLDKTSKNLKVSAAGQTHLVEISFDGNDPKEAARFANALASEFINQNMESHWLMSRRTSDWLAGQLDDLRDKLRSSEDALQAYARQKGLLYTGENQNVSEDKLRQLQATLSNAQADRVEKQSRFEIARDADSQTLPEVLNDGNLRTLESTLIDLRRQEAALSITFKPDYALNKKLGAQIAELESAIDQKRSEIVTRIGNELHESQRREQLLKAAYATQAQLVTDDSEKSIQYDLLKHDVDSNRRIYEAMLQRVKESSIVSAMKTSNVRVIDPATPPSHPYKPNLPMNGGLGLSIGVLCAVLAIVVRARTDGSVREPGDAGLLLGIPELGVIPSSETQPRRMAAGLGQLPPNRALQAAWRPLMGAGESAAVADSFRAVLASILFAGARERRRVLVVTSATPGEGKTTTATNLAVTLANMNRKVLLIDGDIRSPRLHDIFELDNSTGLTDLLGQGGMDEKLLDASIRRTSSPSLYVLPSGPAVQAGADLFFSSAMAAIIARYREQFDMVLIDTPPMLSMPDARMLSRLSDAVILVARAGQTTRSAIQAAFRRLIEDHASVLGIVLNDWKAESSAHQYYAAYKYRAAEAAIDPTAAKAP